MLTRSTRATYAAGYGVADDQIRLDHLLSHTIAAAVELVDTDVVLIGGTPLSRTFLQQRPWVRLSEDLDVMVSGDHRTVAEVVTPGYRKRCRASSLTSAGQLLPPLSARPATRS